MLGVLLVAPNMTYQAMANSGAVATLPYVVAMVFGLAVIGSLMVWSRKQSKRIQWLIIPVLLIMMAGLVGGRAWVAHRDYLSHTISKPMVVRATVHIQQLSDSPYQPSQNQPSQRPYRQLAVLSKVRVHSDTPLDIALPETMTVLLSAKANPKSTKLAPLQHLTIGDSTTMTLKLSPIAPDKAVGFDSYRWLLSRHIHAQAQVLSVDGDIEHHRLTLKQNIERLRWRYRQALMADADNPAAAVALSLLTGDRAFITPETKQLYQYAGISHLLAISGAHVLFLAIILANMVTWLVNRFGVSLYYYLPRWQLRFGVMVVSALAYALFTGFDVPAVRTVVMLAMVGVFRSLLVGWSSLRVLGFCALLLALVDPYVLWQAGFWLSFVAVALLIAYETNALSTKASPTKTPVGLMASLKEQLSALVALQVYLFVAMLPLSLLFFGQVSLMGVLVNLFAVGLFGWVIVPLNLLAGLFYLFAPSVATLIWAAVITLLTWLHHLIDWLALQFDEPWLVVSISVAGVLLWGLLLLCWRLGFVPKRFALLPMWLLFCMMLPRPIVGVVVTLLPSKELSLSYVVVQDGKDNWLIIGSQPTKRTLDVAQFGDELAYQLAKVQIKRLSGIIVQQNDDKVRQIAEQVAGKLPVAQLWWAGVPVTTSKSNTSVQSCHAQKTLAFGGGTLSVLTGWHELSQTVATCNIAIDSPSPLTLQGDVVAMQGKFSPLTKPSTQLIIDSTSNQQSWQIYQLLCPNPAKFDVLLTHSQSQITADTLAYLNQPRLVFSNHLASIKVQNAAKDRYELLINP